MMNKSLCHLSFCSVQDMAMLHQKLNIVITVQVATTNMECNVLKFIGDYTKSVSSIANISLILAYTIHTHKLI